MNKYFILIIMLLLASSGLRAQGKFSDMEYRLELQASVADGRTPLWLNANKHGLSSLDAQNGYARAALMRPLGADSARRWGVGYGVDAVLPVNYTSKLIVHQAFAELRWLKGVLSVGAKEYPLNLKNAELSSGSQTLGINARPVPQVRLALPDYWTLPIFNGWFHLKGHIAYGMMTDDNWQHDFTQRQSKYADHVLYHSKAGFLKIGNEDVFCPWSLELGLEMAAQFGGTAYRFPAGKEEVLTGNKGLSGFWHAFMPGGSDATEQGTAYENVEGNQLGAWMARINYVSDTWRFGIYMDKYFEDHSSMLMLDYNGYGTGDEWNVRKRRHYFLYDPKDMMLGAELSYKYTHLVRNVVFEYLYSKYQSGPVYHDHTKAFPDHISGRDNYYNHYIYPGWQHWGQVLGNPLYRSPIYNGDGTVQVENNRMLAFHLGVNGNISEVLDYRVKATYQACYGTYDQPYTKRKSNFSAMVEAVYKLPKDFSVCASLGFDAGRVYGNNYGFQLTVTKTGLLNSNKK